MTQEKKSVISEAMQASIGRENPPVTLEVEKTGIRMFARAVGHVDPKFYDETYAKANGHRSLVAPPGFLGTPIFDPKKVAEAPGRFNDGGPTRALNGGTEFEYTDVEICAGDVLTSVTKVLSIIERDGSMGTMAITRRETTFTNQNGEVVCREYGTNIRY